MTFRTFGPLLRNIRRAFAEGMSWAARAGIALRLAASFAAVVILAVAANMIARETVMVIRTLTPQTVGTPPTPKLPSEIATAAAIPPPLNGNRLISAVERYEQEGRSRAESESTTTGSGFLAAKESLQQAALDFKSASPRTSAAALAITKRVSDYIERGRALVDLADERRRTDADYLRNTNAIAEDTQKALDHAWKIFGRVVARQSLVEMRANVDLIRQHADSLLRDGGATGDGSNALLVADESRILRLIDANDSSLARSEGAEWVKTVRGQVHLLVARRESLEDMNSRYSQAERQFVRGRRLLSADISAASSAQADVIRHAPATARLPPALRAPVQLAPQGGTAFQDAAGERADHGAPRAMAIVTALVMFVICLISVFTVRSVVIPVKRLVKAAGLLAHGEPIAAVARGGIRELDQLTGAFNDMASQLQAYHAARKDQQKRLEATVMERTQKLQRLSREDPLTSLPNRRQLNVLLNAAIERASREKRYVGVYFLDIDNFKNINDTLGHAFGDRVLMSVANRLEELIDGLGFIARLGGDEFTMVYEDAASLAVMHEFGEMVSREFQKLLAVDERQLSISVSLGVSFFPLHGSDADGLLRAADSALFRAKELGRTQLVVFTPELIASAASRFGIEQGLRRAIENSEFELAYQPEINLATAQTEVLEALLRWRLPDGRIAKPGEFLSVAEQSGLITEINSWVMRTAMADASRWYQAGWLDVRVAINISPRQLLDHRFVESVLALLQEFALPAECIELELTEMAFQTGSATVAALRTLHSHGFGIALDDFGTGYSSLTSLEKLPLSRIKLDRSLISGIDSSPRAAAIVRAIIDLCDGLRLQVTAEGIERTAQFNWFLVNRSISLQGYLFSDAVPFGEVLALRDALAHKVHDLFLSAPPPALRQDSRSVSTPEESCGDSRQPKAIAR
ncbi:MAG: EAL domain-containing protein [Gammaproteobacteria bacterium]